MNGQIRSPQVRLIGHDGKQLGVQSITEAINTAQNVGLDLVEISPQSNPPVCKIIDFSKFRYEREKKAKEARKHHHGGQLKEMRFRVKIGPHDFDIKANAIEEFLRRHNKVRVSIIFYGREMEHRDLGMELVRKLKEKIVKVGQVEQEPQLLGNRMIMILTPHH